MAILGFVDDATVITIMSARGLNSRTSQEMQNLGSYLVRSREYDQVCAIGLENVIYRGFCDQRSLKSGSERYLHKA